MNLKQQRFALILLLLISMLMHLAYGLEGQAQVKELEHQNNRQQAVIISKDKLIKTQNTLINGQYKLIDELTEQFERQLKPKQTYVGEYTITAYCPCAKCCGKHALNRQNDIVTGAMGVELKEGVSVASPLPFGTKLIINDDEYIVQDRTSEWVAKKYDDKIIDIYFDKHEDAEAFGKQISKVYKLEEVK